MRARLRLPRASERRHSAGFGRRAPRGGEAVRARGFSALVAIAVTAFELRAAAAEGSDPARTSAGAAASERAAPADLQSPLERDRRGSAYSLPKGVWGFDVGALGLSGGDAFAPLGVGYGFGAGIDAELNLAHVGVGLLNVAGKWNFLDTKYLGLGLGLAVWYGHGDWFWIVRGPAKEILSKLDALSIPFGLFASVPA